MEQVKFDKLISKIDEAIIAAQEIIDLINEVKNLAENGKIEFAVKADPEDMEKLQDLFN